MNRCDQVIDDVLPRNAICQNLEVFLGRIPHQTLTEIMMQTECADVADYDGSFQPESCSADWGSCPHTTDVITPTVSPVHGLHGDGASVDVLDYLKQCNQCVEYGPCSNPLSIDELDNFLHSDILDLYWE